MEFAQIDRVCREQLHYAREGVGQDGNGWQIFADEGEIKMYKREEEVNGMVMDPLKAYHSVKGVTAREMCHYFFMPEFRNDWESELGKARELKWITSFNCFSLSLCSHAGGLHNTGENLSRHIAFSADTQTHLARQSAGCTILVAYAQNNRWPRAGHTRHVGGVQQLNGIFQTGGKLPEHKLQFIYL